MNSKLLKDIRNSTGAFKKKQIKRKKLNLDKKAKCKICGKEFYYLVHTTSVCSVECAKGWLKK